MLKFRRAHTSNRLSIIIFEKQIQKQKLNDFIPVEKHLHKF